MTVAELVARFPEVPQELRDEPILADFAARFGALLATARKPGNCSTAHDAGNDYYVKLLGPIAYYGYGLATRERLVADLTELIERHAADPEAFVRSLLSDEAVAVEVKGPGCD